MAYQTADIRNVCLAGPSNAGKTTLVEALLKAGGSIQSCGEVERGNTVADFHPREREFGHSLHPAVCHLDHEGIHVNVVDTPGYPDFYGRALAVLPAVETAAIVVDAQNGVDLTARRMMEAAARQRLCRMIIVNKIDAEGVDHARIMEEIQSAFGAECLPINLPSASGEAVVDCFFQLEGEETAFSDVATAHEKIIDQVVELDEELMEVYLEQGQELAPEQLHDPFEKALREGHLVPVCFVSAKTGAGVRQLLRIFERLMPNPTEGNPAVYFRGEDDGAEEVVATPDADAHVVAHVFMVNIDPFKGRLAVFRIHQGTVRPGMQLFVGDARKPVKVGQLLKLNGAEHVKAERGIPGDICAIPRLEEAHYDAVLHDSHDEDHYHLKSLRNARPMYGLAIKLSDDADVQKISDALHSVEAEDPSLHLEHVPALNEIVLNGLGDLHLRTVLEEIRDRYGIEVETAPPSIAYRETITAPAEGHHRHKKQTGGAGQFGEVYLRIEPLEPGEGFEFKSEVVGGAIPSGLIPAVETGVRQVMESGAVAGFPMQDVRVVVYDGKYHTVDSKEIAFVQAGKKAFMSAVDNASPVIMEPIVDVVFRVPADCVGAVTGDLSGMRGIVSGTAVLGVNRMEISGQAPLEEIQGYHSRLKSISGGEGRLSMEFSHYARVPHNIQERLIAAHREARG
jgi:elongation factor G